MQELEREASALRGAAVLVLVWLVPTAVSALQRTTAAPLVFNDVTVVDVEHGKLVTDQRVVVAGNRIQAVGSAGRIQLPKGARFVEARGKYLIPGLWDMHVHLVDNYGLVEKQFLANGVTGIRDAGASVPLDSLIRWRKAVLAGTRIGPPRQILSGLHIDELDEGRKLSPPGPTNSAEIIRGDTSAARRLVDSLVAAGADMLKPHNVSRAVYVVIANEARRLGRPFGGHADGGEDRIP